MLWRALLILWLFSPMPALAGAACEALLNGDATLMHQKASCGTSRLVGGGTQTTCYWSYEYRAPEAQVLFDQMKAQIETCLGADAALPADTPVNHPDSFVLNQYEAKDLRVSLSLKDKGKLRQTLIFLSFSDVP